MNLVIIDIFCAATDGLRFSVYRVGVHMWARCTSSNIYLCQGTRFLWFHAAEGVQVHVDHNWDSIPSPNLATVICMARAATGFLLQTHCSPASQVTCQGTNPMFNSLTRWQPTVHVYVYVPGAPVFYSIDCQIFIFKPMGDDCKNEPQQISLLICLTLKTPIICK